MFLYVWLLCFHVNLIFENRQKEWLKHVLKRRTCLTWGYPKKEERGNILVWRTLCCCPEVKTIEKRMGLRCEIHETPTTVITESLSMSPFQLNLLFTQQRGFHCLNVSFLINAMLPINCLTKDYKIRNAFDIRYFHENENSLATIDCRLISLYQT